MQSKIVQLETEQILNIPKEWEFKTKRVIMTWDEEKKELEIRPDYRRRMFRLPGQPKVIPNDWKNHVLPLTAKERREIRRYKKAN
jgi:hypothetical protein